MSQRFDFIDTSLAGLIRVNRKPIEDNRGLFSRVFCTEEYEEIGFSQSIVQINHSYTEQKGTIRGMHFQYPPSAETKIISCIQGEIFDVVIDIRKDSKTFMQFHSEILSEDDQSLLFVPEGFAHGFQTLTNDCQILYLVSAQYDSEAESAINPLDPLIGIEWPLKVTRISEKDLNHPMLDVEFEGIEIS